ncbi:MAG: hypothetical protein AAF721_33910 [Myxococcota bacterium]
MATLPTRVHRRTTAAGLLGALASLCLGATVGVSTGCYSEREPPPTFRYKCDGDGDCGGGEACRGGICERTCTLATAEEDCGADFVTCFNGACASTCEVDAGSCPSVQECVDLSALGIDLGGGASNPFGGGSSAALGICGRMCDDDNDLCPDGETCLLGFCAATCDVTVEGACSDGFVCVPPGVCAPGDAGAMTGGEMTGGAMTGGEMTGGAMTGGEMTGGEMTGGEMTGGEMTGGEMTGGSGTMGGTSE